MFFLEVLWNGEILLSVRDMHFDILMKINLNLMKLQAFGKVLHLLGSSEVSYNITNFHEELLHQRVFQLGLKKISSAVATVHGCSLG